MRDQLRFVGLDVHAETIAVGAAEPNGEVRSLGSIANREHSIRKFIKKLGSPEQLRSCYEAGPKGFEYLIRPNNSKGCGVLSKYFRVASIRAQPRYGLQGTCFT
jgi:hypothetical protein